MAPRSTVEALVRGGRFRDALEAAARSSVRNSDSVVLQAELSQLTGDNIRAREMASALARELSAKPSLLSRCYEILGAVSVDEGDVDTAVDLFTRSITLAQESDNLIQACRSQLRLLPTIADIGGGPALASLSVQARRNTLRVADRQLMALLHLRFGQIEAKRGLLDRARRHLDLAWALLKDEPNVWIDGLLSLDASAVSAIAGEPNEAISFAVRALECSAQSGHARTRVAALANLAVLRLNAGDLSESQQYLDDAVRSAAGFDRVRVALLDTQAQLALLNGDTMGCEALLGEVSNWVAGKKGAKSSWVNLATDQTRIRLMFRQQRWNDAIETAQRAARLAAGRLDRFLETNFRMLEAEALTGAGRAGEAATAFNRALKLATDTSPEVITELERVRAKVLFGLGRVQEAEGRLAWVNRHLKRGGIVWTRVGAAADRALITSDYEPLRDHGRFDSDGLERLHQGTVEAIELLFRLASKPEPLALQAVHLLASLDCLATVTVSPGSDPGLLATLGLTREIPQESAPRPEVLHCELVGGDGEALDLIVQPRDSRLNETCALTVTRLIQAAVELETLRRREKERTSLWPADVDLETGVGVFASSAMHELLSTVERVATTDLSVLITGETGVGKELIAREVHRRSRRSGSPFVPFNCAAVPKDMLESQLFGHRRGAFTGASDNFPGVIRSGAGGSLFLDEIGELGLDVQPKLLRYLENNEVHPLGEARPVTVDVRTIAATNVDLERLVREGRFRDDLYYRLNVVCLHVPPLRERREEVPLLADHFLDRYAQEMRKPRLRMTDEALEYLVLFRWPGNIRQLANEIRRIVALAPPGDDLVPAMLSGEILAARRTIAASQPPAGEDEIVVRTNQRLAAALEQVERVMVERALGATSGHLERAAERLGISRKGLFLKRRRLGVHP